MIGILVSLGLLMFLAYRGVSVLILAPALALLAVLFAQGGPVLGSYTQIFMTALGGYVIKFFPLFLLGAIFGKVMQVSGAASSIARAIVGRLGAGRAMAAVVAACAVLTYGGVSLFVVAFAVYPIAASLFVAADLPKRFIPGAIALGAFTFTMTALPGTPQIQNAIPAPFFGTDGFAAPIHGTVAAIIIAAFGLWWLSRRIGRAKAAGEGYGEQDEFFAARTDGLAEGADGAAAGAEAQEDLPPLWSALTPVVLVIVVNLLVSRVALPAFDMSYLAEDQYGGASLDDVRGIWSLIVALVVAILATVALNFRRFKNLNKTLTEGVSASFLPIFNTASEVGYGTVIASLAAFATIRDGVLAISPDNPLISEAVAVNVLAGITGSASGGMSIALNTLGSTYMELAQATGTDPELMHRVAALASGGFDVLPHNGAVVTLLALTGLTHMKSYFDIFMVAIVGPLLGLLAVLGMAMVF